ncbi:MAG TPA: right-handed parallel beta-helix repeat-containing protein [Candidatus Limnocylindrales bacterium]|jgi:parallel beta-helix repeat protein|nr:right-handed parallel beta-helix repeat-containing protein [Candidatus Limnocylindrales bacterium]
MTRPTTPRSAFALALAVALALPIGLARPTTVDAATTYRFVSTTGSDSWSGSSTRPWRTIQHAVDYSPAGTVIGVRTGKYPHFVVRRSGLTVRPAGTSSVTVYGSKYVVRFLGVTSGTVRGLFITGAPYQYGSGVRVEASSNVLIDGNTIYGNHSFGIKVKDSTNTLIRGNRIYKNDTGIELAGAVAGTNIYGNQIHHNDRMVDSGRGGNGIVFAVTTGAVSVQANKLWTNRARHTNGVGYDGGAFEVYGSSDLLIRNNSVWDNNNVMETGTDGVHPCARITFTRNLIRGRSTVAGETKGLILRCAADSLIAHNTIDTIDDFAFYVEQSSAYAGSIDGLRIADNIVYLTRAYSLKTGLPSTISIDHDLIRPGGTAPYATRVAYIEGLPDPTIETLTELRIVSPYGDHSLQADPRFVDRNNGVYTLRSDSPAIDHGVQVTSDPYSGAAPDIGKYEYVP